MKKATFLFFLGIAFCPAQSQIINIKTLGAVGDGVTLNTSALQKAVDSCAKMGGGTVYVPPGIFVTGTFHLKSNVTLQLENGAVIKGSPSLKDYDRYKVSGYDSQYYGLIYTRNAENVTIAGQGTIDGNDTVFFDWNHAKIISDPDKRFTRQKSHYREVSRDIGDGPVVPHSDRPHQMVIFSDCKKVSVRDVNLINSPFWTLHFADCDAVTVSGLRLWSHLLVPNSDGIDVTSCSNVTISDCDIRTGDDAIAITGYDHHFEIPGFSGLRHASENIIVSNCQLQSCSSGIRIGFLDQNSVRNVLVSNVNITNSTRGIGIFLRDEGSLENIRFSHMNIETVLRTGDWWGNGEPIHISAVRGKEKVSLGRIRQISFDHIYCESENGILLYADQESPLTEIRFEEIRINLRQSPLNVVAGGNIDLRGCLADSEKLFAHDIPAFMARNVNGLSLNGFHVHWEKNIADSFFTCAFDIQKIKDLQLVGISGSSAPMQQKLPAINLSEITGLTADSTAKAMTGKRIGKPRAIPH